MSRVDQSLKDFELMLEMGGRVDQPLPFASCYAQLMREVVAQGQGSLDNAAIVHAIRRLRSAG